MPAALPLLLLVCSGLLEPDNNQTASASRAPKSTSTRRIRFPLKRTAFSLFGPAAYLG